MADEQEQQGVPMDEGGEPVGDESPAAVPDQPEPEETKNEAGDAALAAAKAAIAGLSLGDFGGFSDDADVAEESIAASTPASMPFAHATPLELPDFADSAGATMPAGMDLLADVNLHVTIELGRTRMQLDEVLKMTPGVVVELDKLAGDPVDVFVNERRVARGEVLVLNDNFCVRINEILEIDDATSEFVAA